MKRHLSSICFAAFLLFGCAAHVPPAHAQFLGYTSPQTTTSAPFGGTPSAPTVITCTGANQTSAKNAIQNVGQSAHYLFLATTDIVQGSMVLQGSNDGVTFQNISDVALYSTISGTSSPNGFLVGTGYYNFIRVQVNCQPAGHFTVQYSGTSVTPGSAVGAQQLTQYDKTIISANPTNLGAGSNFFQPPFGNASGLLSIAFPTGNAPTLAIVQVVCQTLSANQMSVVFNLTLTGGLAQALQQYRIAPIPCQSMQVTYFPSGGSSGSNVFVDYLFTIPGGGTTSMQYTHITTTTANVVKPGPGTLHTLTINTGAAGTISLFDLPTASCTGTPSTNTVAVLTSFASDPAKAITFDAWFTQGICVKASAAMDLTVNFN